MELVKNLFWKTADASVMAMLVLSSIGLMVSLHARPLGHEAHGSPPHPPSRFPPAASQIPEEETMAICIDRNIAGGEPHVAGTSFSVYYISRLASSNPTVLRSLIEGRALSQSSVDEAVAYARSNPPKQVLLG